VRFLADGVEFLQLNHESIEVNPAVDTAVFRKPE